MWAPLLFLLKRVPVFIRDVVSDLLGELEGGGGTGWKFMSPCWRWVPPPPAMEGLCCSSLLPSSTFTGWLDSFSSCLHLLWALWGRKHLSLCTAKRTNFCPLGSWFRCKEDYDIHNSPFVSYWQGSPGRRGPQGEQGEPGPKVSLDTQRYHRLCLLRAVSEAWRRSAESSVQLDVFIPGLSWTP